MVAHTGIATRHLTVPRAVVDDILNGTRHSRSVFLPGGPEGGRDAGPTTGQRMRVYAADAGPLSLRAARQALEQARLRPAEVTHLVTVSCTGFTAPGVDLALVSGLPLPATVQRTHVGFM